MVLLAALLGFEKSGQCREADIFCKDDAEDARAEGVSRKTVESIFRGV